MTTGTMKAAESRKKQKAGRRILASLPVLLLIANWSPAVCLCANPFVHLGRCGPANQPADSATSGVGHCHTAESATEPECDEPGLISRAFLPAASSAPTSLDCCNAQSGTISSVGIVSTVPLNLESEPEAFQPETARTLPYAKVFRPPRSRPIYLSLSSFLI
jgi:hypothetical protein